MTVEINVQRIGDIFDIASACVAVLRPMLLIQTEEEITRYAYAAGWRQALHVHRSIDFQAKDVIRQDHDLAVMYSDSVRQLDIGSTVGLALFEPSLNVPGASFRVPRILEDGDDTIARRLDDLAGVAPHCRLELLPDVLRKCGVSRYRLTRQPLAVADHISHEDRVWFEAELLNHLAGASQPDRTWAGRPFKTRPTSSRSSRICIMTLALS